MTNQKPTPEAATDVQQAAPAVGALLERVVGRHPTALAGTGMFDEWMQNPYTKVLMESMDRDYMPRVDAEALRNDAERYRKWRADYTMPDGTDVSELALALGDAWTPEQVDAALDAAPAVGAA